MGLYFCYTEIRKQKKGALDMEYELRWVYGHVEVYDNAGRFWFSADSEREALAELEDMAA